MAHEDADSVGEELLGVHASQAGVGEMSQRGAVVNLGYFFTADQDEDITNNDPTTNGNPSTGS